jgi:hypothetical protein
MANVAACVLGSVLRIILVNSRGLGDVAQYTKVP